MRLFAVVTVGFAYLLGTSLALAQNQKPNGPKGNRTASQPLKPAASAEAGSREETVLGYVEPYGFVRDTPAALASLTQPLSPAPGRNDLVAACRAMVEKSAEAHGAEWVEATSAGPQRRVRDGTVAPVRFRIWYPGVLRSQVRQARLLCKADRAGNVVDARP
jgi:hypothetical protein